MEGGHAGFRERSLGSAGQEAQLPGSPEQWSELGEQTMEASEFRLLLEAVDATSHAMRLWLKLLGPYLGVLLRFLRRKVIQLAWLAVDGLRAFEDLSQENKKAVLQASVVLVTSLTCRYLIRRLKVSKRLRDKYNRQASRLRARWLSLHRKVAKSSKLLADLLPHILLLFAFTAFWFVAPQRLRAFAESDLFYLAVTRVYLVILSSAACVEGSAGLIGAHLKLRVSLTLSELLWEVPVLMRVAAWVAPDFIQALRLLFLVWAAVPFTAGASHVANTAPFLLQSGRRGTTGKLRVSLRGARLQAAANRFVDLAVTLRILPAGIKHVGTQLHQSGLQLLTLFFLFTPSFITYYGCVVAGRVLPARSSVTAVHAKDLDEQAKWLTYWTVLTVAEAGHAAVTYFVGWVPLWTHIKLLGILWLQLPLFDGAQTLFQRLEGARVLKVRALLQNNVPHLLAMANRGMNVPIKPNSLRKATSQSKKKDD